VPRPVPPEMQLALERVQRPPRLQGLKEGLFQPKAGVGTIRSIRRRLDARQRGRMPFMP
jgi:hypothetical protein